MLTSWSCGCNRSGASVTASRKTTGAAAATHAHQRQRGEGSDPVGVSSRTKPTQANAVTTVAGMYRATKLAAGSARGRTSSPQARYCAAAPVAIRDTAWASSSQPTGWRERRLASTAPTVTALTSPTTGRASHCLRSGRPAWRSK